jgi:hypothetical protein
LVAKITMGARLDSRALGVWGGGSGAGWGGDEMHVSESFDGEWMAG